MTERLVNRFRNFDSRSDLRVRQGFLGVLEQILAFLERAVRMDVEHQREAGVPDNRIDTANSGDRGVVKPNGRLVRGAVPRGGNDFEAQNPEP